MDIFTLLKEDHTKVSELFSELEAIPERSFEKREQLFFRIKAELTAHSDAEEAVFYARLIQKESLKTLLADSYVEHQEVSALLDELTSLAVNNDGWMPKCRLLQNLVKKHVQKEETEVFNKAKGVFDAAEAEELGHEFLGLKDNSIGISA